MKHFHRNLLLPLSASALMLGAGCVADSTSDEPAASGGGDEIVMLDKDDDYGKADSVTARYVMHFYPKLKEWEGRWEQTGVFMLAKRNEYIFAVYARGGPETQSGTAGATPTGTYKTSTIGPKQGSNRWPMSIVQWGSTMTVDESDQGLVTAVYENYTDMAGQAGTRQLAAWKLAWVNTKDFSSYIGLVFNDTDQSGRIEESERTVDNMHFGAQVRSGAQIYTNDFGHMSAYLGKYGVYLHPTSPMYHESNGQPTDECSTMSGSCHLADSHGCIHVAPATIDYLVVNGWLRKRTSVVVHGYDEDPPEQTAELLAKLPDVDAGRGHATERNNDCACDYYDGVCEAAIKGALLTCECDYDCYTGDIEEACSRDKHCDSWCPGKSDPDC